jgi:serine/threonine protein kinase
MTRDEALHLLDLNGEFAPGEVEAAASARRAQLERRVASAPTEALREKYRRQLDELDEAQAALLSGAAIPSGSGLSQTMLADLPLAQAAYTQLGGVGAAGNAGVMLKPGQALGGGRYEIGEQVGAGGMGAVYRAFDKNRDKDIAIKVLLPSMFARPKAKERFLQEARLSSEMPHPHIVTVFDVQQDGPHTFLTMELLRGQTLRAYLATLKNLRKAMAVDEALKIVEQACQGLAYAHEKGAVHRDIKPENVWLSEDGKAKVMDFGIARFVTSSQMTQTQMALGTAYYMAPEQLQGLADIDGRADQYAVAVMLYEMLSGNLPTGRVESLSRVRKDIPAAVSKAVDKALSPRREERFGDIQSFREGLRGKGMGFSAAALAKGAGLLAAAGLAAGLALSYPQWRGWLPDKDQQNSLQQDVARQEGEAKALQKQVEERRREVDGAAQNAKRDVERIESQLNSVRNDADKQTLQIQLWGARNAQAAAESVERGFREALEGGEGLAFQEGQMKAAEAAVKAKQLEQAKALLEGVHSGYLKLKETPDRIRLALKTQRAQWLEPLNGKWGKGDCQGASTWSVKDPALTVFWPKAGVFEEKIVDVGGGGVVTVTVSPAQYKGRLYRYQPSASALEVSEVNSGRREVLQRCP